MGLYNVNQRTAIEFVKNRILGTLTYFSLSDNLGLSLPERVNQHIVTAPFVIDDDGKTLYTHIRKTAPYWDKMEGKVIASFYGPDDYISARAYQDPDAISTWHFMRVDARGRREIIDDKAGILGILARTSDLAESKDNARNPWNIGVPSPGKVDRLSDQIFGLRISLDEGGLTGYFKFDQGETHSGKLSLIEYLTLRGAEYPKTTILRMIQDNLK
ncbi:MAG TPA: FMN-binding negative transcriptional regulator [Candidatus Nanoarchaeia archaeon]|nr:FMN-binding negative transcriptional regulator [Candidatus Nanoarchaeia archaeon]